MLTTAVNPRAESLGAEYHHPVDRRRTKRKHPIVIVLQMFSTPKRRAPLSLTGLSLLFIALSVLVKAVGTLWVKKQISALTREYSA